MLGGKKKTVERERKGFLCQIKSSAGIQIYLIMSDDVYSAVATGPKEWENTFANHVDDKK